MPTITIDIFRLPHATNENEYYVDANITINGETFYTEDTLTQEDIDLTTKRMTFEVEGHKKLDGRYIIYVPRNKWRETTLYRTDSAGNEYLIHTSNITNINCSRYHPADDDPVWDILGYERDKEDGYTGR